MLASYAPGSLGAMLAGRRLRILDSFVEARQAAKNGEVVMIGQEAMSTSDFATYIGSFLRHRFLGRFREISGAWPQYTHPFSVQDFESYTGSRFGRFPDIPEKPLNGPYHELAIRELPGPSVKLKEWGATFALTRQLVLSDRLGEIAKLPIVFADAMARTISKKAAAIIEANANTYDSVPLFDNSGHGNTVSTALTADINGANALITAMTAIEAQTDDEGYKIVQPNLTPRPGYVLIVPPALRFVAAALASRETLPLDATSGTSLLRPNPVQGLFTPVVEPYLTDATDWFLAWEPTSEQGFLAAVTLNGNTQPHLGVKDSDIRGLQGSADEPYSFEFDEIEYRIRHDYNFVATEWRTVYRGGHS